MCVCLSVLVFSPTALQNIGNKEGEHRFIGGGLVEIESRGRIIIRERDKEVQRI